MKRTAHPLAWRGVRAGRQALGFALPLALVGCGGGTAATSPSQVGPLVSDDARDGFAPETALYACFETRSDYRRVAEYRCADGSMPLGGEVSRGGRARLGNMGAGPDGHILDVYRVPCPEGPVQLYVDGYHCDRELAPLSEAEIQQAMNDLRLYVVAPEESTPSVMSRALRARDQLGIQLPECPQLDELLVPSEAELAEWRIVGSIYVAAQIVGLFELHRQHGAGADVPRGEQMDVVRAAARAFVGTYRRLVAAGYTELRTERLDSLAALPEPEFQSRIDARVNACNLQARMPGYVIRVQDKR